MSNVRQQPNEQEHALNTRITTLVNNCRFEVQQTTETIKIMFITACSTIPWSKRLDLLTRTKPINICFTLATLQNVRPNDVNSSRRLKSKVEQN